MLKYSLIAVSTLYAVLVLVLAGNLIHVVATKGLGGAFVAFVVFVIMMGGFAHFLIERR